MNSFKRWGFLLVAWLGLCLILLLAACSTLQQAGLEQAACRVMITLPPGSSEAELLATLNDNPPVKIDFKPYAEGYDDHKRLTGSRLVLLTFADEQAEQNFRRQLQQAGLALQSITTQH